MRRVGGARRRRKAALLARAGAVLLAVALLAPACGGSESRLEGADDALSGLQRGNIKVSVAATARSQGGTSAGPVGFTVEGPFDLDAGSALPVLDLTYTRLLGAETHVLEVKSDGSRLVVVNDGVPTDVPPDQAAAFRVDGDQRPTGLEELGISGWVEDPAEDEGPLVDGVPTTKVTGKVDAADLVSDIAQLATQVAEGRESEPLDDEAADRLRGKVRSSAVEVLLDDDDLPRRVRATVEFAPDVNAELERALGPYAGAGLEVVLEVNSPGEPLAPPVLP